MEVTKEFFDCLTWASAAFVSGICLREWCKQMVGQWIGRANVAAALFVMSAFGLHSARQCSVLINLVEHSHANPVSNQTGFVALEKEYAISTDTGHTVSIARFDSGLYGPVSFAGRSSGRISFAGEFVGSAITGSDGTTGRENRRFGAVPPGTSF